MLLHSFQVTRGEANQTVAAFLRGRLKLSWSQAKQLVERRQVRVAGQSVTDPAQRLRPGKRVEVHGSGGNTAPQRKTPPKPAPKAKAARKAKPKRQPEPKPAPSPGPSPEVVYADDAVVVVNKPAGLTTVRHPEEAAEHGARARRFLPPTLADMLPGLLGEPNRPVRAVHRIDRDTSGLVVFARTPEAERHLGQQFRAHTIDRRYLALVRGRPQAGRIESRIVRDRGDGRRGSTTEPGEGQRAITHVRIVEDLGPFALVECRLETGRTHQVRIHLGEQCAPLCGERVYDRPVNGPPLPDASGASRPMLHAARLGFTHPRTGEWLEWEAPLPEDMAKLLERLRHPAV